MEKRDLIRIHDWLWEIPRSHRGDMIVPARIFTTETMLDGILADRSLDQLVNVATLPGIRRFAVAMPDIHEGYGFPIGGVAAVDAEEGVISPGGIGYDINCGVRLLRTGNSFDEIRTSLPTIAHSIAREIPSGVGRGGRLTLQDEELDRVLDKGARRIVEMGYGEETDLQQIESSGTIAPADAALVSSIAKKRGRDQLGTIGSGNHFVEVDVVDTVFDAGAASRFRLAQGQIVVLIHTGSRGLGHQVATDHLRTMAAAMARYGIHVPDRELACVPIRSPEGRDYLLAMAAAANFAFANRQTIAAGVRRVWKHELGSDAAVETVYDVAHNIAKREEHRIDGATARLIVHRKGATRAFPGQPVLIPGSMGTASYLLLGQEAAMEESFGSSCHGAGRVMSRMRAKREISGPELRKRMASLGVAVEAGSMKGLVEEAPEAYKDVDAVVDVVHRAGIARKVVRLRPVAVVKG
ncbi:MAG TPA: RtcB family protein [Thermoanaerobaculia bacterium]|nr:RtcB family protein [Thermoanaerobaculia bacterium]